MLSDDVFRRAFETATANLTAWAERQRDSADVEIEGSEDFWRVRLMPFAANACPAELILHRASQTYDIQIGAEASEANRINALDDFMPLLDAVADGRVTTRMERSVATGALLRLETEVSAIDRPTWMLQRTTPIGQRLTSADATTHEKHWVPYRR